MKPGRSGDETAGACVQDSGFEFLNLGTNSSVYGDQARENAGDFKLNARHAIRHADCSTSLVTALRCGSRRPHKCFIYLCR